MTQSSLQPCEKNPAIPRFPNNHPYLKTNLESSKVRLSAYFEWLKSLSRNVFDATWCHSFQSMFASRVKTIKSFTVQPLTYYKAFLGAKSSDFDI